MKNHSRPFPAWLALLLLPASAVAAAWSPTAPPEAALLPVNKAFRLLPAQTAGRTLHLEWIIAPGYFLYRQRLQVVPAGSGRPLPLQAPTPLRDDEPGVGSVEIYRKYLRLQVTLPAQPPVSAVEVHYQGCSDAGVCYPPQTRTVTLEGPPDAGR